MNRLTKVAVAATIFTLTCAASGQSPSPAQGFSLAYFYEPADVTSLTLTFGKRSVTLKKNNDQWHKVGEKAKDPVDAWSVQRRLVALSHFESTGEVNIAAPLGHLEIRTANAKIVGDFDETHFQWRRANQKPQGFSFEAHSDLGRLLGEGVQGFDPHQIIACEAGKVETVALSSSWTLSLNNGAWSVKTFDEKDLPVPARAATARAVIGQFCKIKVDYFVANSSTDNEVAVVTARKMKNPLIISNSSGFYFMLKFGAFTSATLDVLMHTPIADLRDPAAEWGRIAVNPTLSPSERVDAIHKIKSAASPAAIPALKTLVNEQTDIDVFRYEATDALQSIGTKEAFRIIADRLSNATASGFQLKLARTLGLSKGQTIFASDNTSEGERQIEIRKLLEAYHKDPIGR